MNLLKTVWRKIIGLALVRLGELAEKFHEWKSITVLARGFRSPRTEFLKQNWTEMELTSAFRQPDNRNWLSVTLLLRLYSEPGETHCSSGDRFLQKILTFVWTSSWPKFWSKSRDRNTWKTWGDRHLEDVFLNVDKLLEAIKRYANYGTRLVCYWFFTHCGFLFKKKLWWMICPVLMA